MNIITQTGKVHKVTHVLLQKDVIYYVTTCGGTYTDDTCQKTDKEVTCNNCIKFPPTYRDMDVPEFNTIMEEFNSICKYYKLPKFILQVIRSYLMPYLHKNLR